MQEPEKKSECEPEEVIVQWNGVNHMQLLNKYHNDKVIHFPWARNSCALDSTLSALWIVYLAIQDRIE